MPGSLVLAWSINFIFGRETLVSPFLAVVAAAPIIAEEYFYSGIFGERACIY